MQQPKKIVYEYETPDGILEWEDDETPEGEARARAGFAKEMKANASPDKRGAAQLGLEQAAHGVKGAVMLPVRAGQFAWGLGQGAGEATGKLLEGDVSGALQKGKSVLSDLYHGIADPFEHAGQLVGEAIAPGSQPGDIMDPERLAQSAEAAGTNAAGVGLMTKPGQRLLQKNAIPQSENLMQTANRLRNNSPRPTGDPTVDMARAIISGQSSPSATVNLARGAMNVAKKPIAKGFELAARAKAVLEKKPTFSDKAAPVAGPEIPIALPDETYVPQERAPMQPSEPIPMNMPDETFQYQEAAAPVQSEPIPFEFPEAVEPMTAPTPMGKPTPAEVTMAEQALAPSGNQRRLSTIRNTPDLLELAPELRGLEAGPQFDATLHQGFKNMEGMVDAAEKSVPRDTRVSINDLKQDLLAVQADYTLRAMPKAVADVQRVIDNLNERFGPSGGAVPWEDFLRVKRGLLKDSRAAASTPLRRAYGAFMQASKEVSPALSEANKAYSTFMRALENANMDPVSGRRISQVGKAQKAEPKTPTGQKPVGYAPTKPLSLFDQATPPTPSFSQQKPVGYAETKPLSFLGGEAGPAPSGPKPVGYSEGKGTFRLPL